MIREVDLASYLPLFMQKYREPVEALKAEDPEFLAVWEAADRILYNHFICTADEYGISRFEKMLGILHSGGETLEERRKRIQGYYVGDLPYTENKMRAVLAVMCGAGNFELDVDGAAYQMTVRVIDRDIQLAGNVHRIVSYMKPANILLKLYEVYRGEAGQDAGSRVAGIRFTMGFYPRFNLRRLHLDSIWKLDGGRKLNGYDGKNPGDLYPVSMGVRVGIVTDTGTVPRTRMEAGAGGEPGSGQVFAVRARASPAPVPGERMRMAVAAVQDIRAGDISISNRNVMDGAWRLNGVRKLNGGPDMR